jgi:hypothetical protein
MEATKGESAIGAEKLSSTDRIAAYIDEIRLPRSGKCCWITLPMRRRTPSRLRRAVIKFSILRFDEALPDLRLRSIHNPEKKDSTISAIAEGAILGLSASIFIARSRCSSVRFSVMTP